MQKISSVHIFILKKEKILGLPSPKRTCPFLTTLTRDFPNIFYWRFSVVKTQSSIEFENKIFHPFHFNNSYFIAIVEVLS